MGKMSKEKGKLGEREVVVLLRAHGFTARRGQQFSGGGDSPDVVHDIPGIHIEVKRTEKLDLYGALEQADRDRPISSTAVVFHRKNKRRWVALMDAEDFLGLLTEWKTREIV